MQQPFIEETGFPGLLIVNPPVFADERGYFYESYNKKTFENHGLYYDFVQDNQARSRYGVLRGLHYQLEPHAQAKLVRVTEGKVLDVVVDLRGGSPTFTRWYGVLLSAENRKQLLIPRGFAHGYVVLSATAEFMYKCDNYYNKASETGIAYDDPTLQIDWKVPKDGLIVSEKDLMLPILTEARFNFTFSG